MSPIVTFKNEINRSLSRVVGITTFRAEPVDLITGSAQNVVIPKTLLKVRLILLLNVNIDIYIVQHAYNKIVWCINVSNRSPFSRNKNESFKLKLL